MGNKEAKANKSQKSAQKLTDKDYKYLTLQTGLTKEQINLKFREFLNNNEDGKLSKSDFANLYSKIREEPADKLNEISNYVFDLFDKDKSGISFNRYFKIYSKLFILLFN